MMDWSILKISVPVLLAIIVWLLNESSKTRWERYKRKEERYIALLNSLRGFYVKADLETAHEEKKIFIQQLSVAWLYCPASVVRKGYDFLNCMKEGVEKSNEERERIIGDFVVSMRKDLLGTKWWFRKQRDLNASEFLHLRSN